jgi:sucrose phosphorylase
MQLLAATGVGRDINRHYYSAAEIDAALLRPVVRDLLALIRVRNTHPAFAGNFRLAESAANVLNLRWERDAEFAELWVDLETAEYRMSYSTPQARQEWICQSSAPQPDFVKRLST